MKIFKNIQEFTRTPEDIQGQHDVFHESRTKRDLMANSRTVLGAQGRLATLSGTKNCPIASFNVELSIRQLRSDLFNCSQT